MDTVWLLIETDETKQQGRTRTGRPVAMSLAAQLRRAARIGLLAAGLVALLITASGTGQLRAQSFNCRYARHPDERVICHDPLLGRLDEELASMYRSLLLRLPKEEGEQLYKEEDAFVILRGRCGAQRACIEESYRRRIRELEEALGKHE
ncbi:MAG: hypothetical protein E6G79_05630 [Alphaproteobacteria bacterium]|jgi:uncharacterized protein|nr:MAG: hypothetical protein E6G79_05630 [Alphaproteobacteria bacterium]